MSPADTLPSSSSVALVKKGPVAGTEAATSALSPVMLWGMSMLGEMLKE